LRRREFAVWTVNRGLVLCEACGAGGGSGDGSGTRGFDRAGRASVSHAEGRGALVEPVRGTGWCRALYSSPRARDGWRTGGMTLGAGVVGAGFRACPA